MSTVETTEVAAPDPETGIANREYINPKSAGWVTICILTMRDHRLVFGLNIADPATYSFAEGQRAALADCMRQVEE